MSVKSVIFNFAKKAYVCSAFVIPGYLGKRFRCEVSEQMVVIDEIKTIYGKIKYFCFGHISLWRSKTLFSKEPEMIEWLDAIPKMTGNKPTIFWDIGANIGLYSVYAGIKGLNVFAFEPSALNTLFLSKNIEINGLKDSVILYPIAVSDKSEFGFLNMSSTQLGGAFNEFSDENLQKVGQGDYEMSVVFRQGMFSYSIDELVCKYGFEAPNFIKIDVDSIEDKIIYGAKEVLSRDNCVKSIFVELDEFDLRTQEVIKFLSDKGFELKAKKHSDLFNDSKFKTQFNYIFERE
ncbi:MULTISPECIES: FkbM family methyltransferase [unclassified Campylobacter]|uniref:FkbM family methyltransferase n=1 Tax=unclassified Campylobacter TaxID=2593542 RepID=UPI003D351A4F